MEHASWQPGLQLLSDVHPGRITAQDASSPTALQWMPHKFVMRGFRANTTSLTVGSKQQCYKVVHGSHVYCDVHTHTTCMILLQYSRRA